MKSVFRTEYNNRKIEYLYLCICHIARDDDDDNNVDDLHTSPPPPYIPLGNNTKKETDIHIRQQNDEVKRDKRSPRITIHYTSMFNYT